MANIERSISRICADLGLPTGDAYTQVWAHELPEEFRSEAWLYRYIEAYRNPLYGEVERRVLAQLSLDAVNDLLEYDESAGLKAWAALVEVIRDRIESHRDQLEYWASGEKPLEDAFALTFFARRLLDPVQGQSEECK